MLLTLMSDSTMTSTLMKVQELRTVLEEVQAIYEASGTEKPAADFSNFIELLNGHEHQSIDAFLAELSTLLKAASGKTASGDREPDSQLVDAFLERLTNAKSDQTEFDAVYAELGANK